MSTHQIAMLEQDQILEFARQLYERCVEQYGENHQQTRMMVEYISGLEVLDPHP
jgi:hypothetical protein